MYKLLLLAVLIGSSVIAYAQGERYISFDQTTEILMNHKKSSNITAYYFDKAKTTLTQHHQGKEERIVVTNMQGEAKIYYPKTNQLAFQQMEALSSKNSLIYYFSNNLTDHLGLADEGFQLTDRSYDQNYLVTHWKAPSGSKQINEVKMVFEAGKPIYAEYLNAREVVLKKIYYTKYKDLFSFRMPQKIIEINYTPEGDSIVNRTIFSNIEVSNTPQSDYFNYKVPEDAKPLLSE